MFFGNFCLSLFASETETGFIFSGCVDITFLGIFWVFFHNNIYETLQTCHHQLVSMLIFVYCCAPNCKLLLVHLNPVALLSGYLASALILNMAGVVQNHGILEVTTANTSHHILRRTSYLPKVIFKLNSSSRHCLLQVFQLKWRLKFCRLSL